MGTGANVLDLDGVRCGGNCGYMRSGDVGEGRTGEGTIRGVYPLVASPDGLQGTHDSSCAPPCGTALCCAICPFVFVQGGGRAQKGYLSAVSSRDTDQFSGARPAGGAPTADVSGACWRCDTETYCARIARERHGGRVDFRMIFARVMLHPSLWFAAAESRISLAYLLDKPYIAGRGIPIFNVDFARSHRRRRRPSSPFQRFAITSATHGPHPQRGLSNSNSLWTISVLQLRLRRAS